MPILQSIGQPWKQATRALYGARPFLRRVTTEAMTPDFRVAKTAGRAGNAGRWPPVS